MDRDRLRNVAFDAWSDAEGHETVTPICDTAGGAAAASKAARFKQITAAVATLLILGAAVFAFRGRETDSAARRTLATATSDSDLAAPAKPADCVYAMFDAARAGDVDTYLDCFAGDARRKIDDALTESRSREQFAARLRGPLVRLKGFAIPGAPEPDGDFIELSVEKVFEGYTETLAVELAKTAAGWKITSLETTGRDASTYGQPAVSMPEE